MKEKELLQQLAALPREIEPARDPWPEISARISQSGPARSSGRRGPARWLRAVAAAVVIAVLAGLLFKPAGLPAPQGPERVANKPAIGSGDGVVALQASMAGSEAEYFAALREFSPVGESRDSLLPATVEIIEQGWVDLQNTESALALALQDNPNDEFLTKRMLELRARQLNFLKQLATLDMNNRRLTI